MPKTKQSSSSRVKEIRETFTYYTDEWRPIREEAKTDMRYVNLDPWDPREKEARSQKGQERPCFVWDELGPYINQLVNDPRQNKRSVKIVPEGDGANDATATLRADIIRGIEYKSKAQMAYTTGFQGAVERSYGYWGVGKRYIQGATGVQAFNQELYIRRIPNPDSVLFDPNFKQLDCSDAMGCFVLDLIRKKDFEQRYPKARITDFDGGDGADYAVEFPEWVKEKEIQVAEFWEVTLKSRTLHMLDDEKGQPLALYEDELPAGFDMARSKRQRKIDERVVTQYITNGIEILDETEIEIQWIPIVPVFGKELYVDEGSGAKRKLISLVRAARDPFMSYCFYRSQEAEEAGMTPKVPMGMYEGQDEGQEDVLASINKVPRAYYTVKAKTEATGDQILPLPVRQPFTPNFQAYEVACEAARRAIQVAMGGSALPTAALRRNEKSGVALKEIDAQEERGTFHFIDNFNTALEHTGRILDAWIPFVYDTKRDIGIRKANQAHSVIRINDPEFQEKDENGQPQTKHYDAKTGDHGVIVETGQSANSLREEASEFANQFIGNVEALANLLPPGAPAKLLALSIKLKGTLGPIGDEMANIISPPPDEMAKQQQAQQVQQQAQQQQEIIVKMQQELEKLKLEKAGKVIDNQFKVQLANMKVSSEQQLAQLDRDIQVLKALLASKQNISDQEYETFRTVWQENHGAAHEAGLQAQQHGHEKDQAAAAAQNAATTQQSDQSHQAAMAEQASSNPEEGAQQ